VCYEQLNNFKESLRNYIIADYLAQGNNPLYLSNIVVAYDGQNMYKKSEPVIIAAYKKFPNHKSVISNYCAYLNRTGQFEQILPLARSLLKLNPVSAYDWFDVAYAFSKGGQKDSAFYFYNVALKIKPLMRNAINNVGLVYKQRGYFEKAHANYNKALTLPDSNYHFAFQAKASAYLWQHDYENAYKWAKMYYERFPEQHGNLDVGYALLQLKRYNEAIPYLFKTLQLEPKDDRALNNLGRCYEQLKQYDSAAYYFNKAMFLNPDNSYIYHNRAALYYDLGKFDLACADLKVAMDKEYTWLVDAKLESMKLKYCPAIKTKKKVLIHEYKGNVRELSKNKFIELSDSLLSLSVNNVIAANIKEPLLDKSDNGTSNQFDSFKIYPNPTTGKFTIESNELYAETLTVNILNEAGAVIHNNSIEKTLIKEIELKNLPNGIYVIMIMTQSSVLTAKKLILQN
jgi:tetratricopeptide (TPR) repeat protein